MAFDPWSIAAFAAAVAFPDAQTVCLAVFLFAGLIIFYALFGYPLLLDWVARRSENPVDKDDKLRSVSFVIAVRTRLRRPLR